MMDASWLKLLPRGLRKRVSGRHELQAVLNNSGWLISDKVLRLFVGMPITILIARYLGPDAFGLLSYAIAFVAIFAALAAAGMDRIAVRELVRDPEGAGSLLATAFVIRVSLAVVAVAAALLAARASGQADPRAFWLIFVIAAGMVVQATDVIDYWNQAQLQSKFTVLAKMAAFLAGSLLRVLMLVWGAPLLAFAFVSLAEVTIGAVCLVGIYFRRAIEHVGYRPSRARAQHLMRESWPLLIAGLAVTLYMRVDIVMLQAMTNPREVGIYASAARLSEVWYTLPIVVAASAYPAILRSRETSSGQYIFRVRQLYFLFCWMAVAISLPATIASGWLVSTLYGPSFAAAAPVLAVHLWGSIGVFLGVASSHYLLAENLQMISMYRTAIGLVSNVLLNLVLIPRYQAQGAAIATVVSYFVATFSIVLFPQTRKHAMYLLAAPVYARNGSRRA